MTRIRLDQITFDAGTQIRAAIDQQVVSDYADAMTEGATFPPIVLFSDGCCRADGTVIYFIADGFHRAMAAKRNQFVDIDADVKPGTKTDALRCALGANKTNGKRLTDADKRHAITLALGTFPDMSQNQIAALIGCSQRYVSTIKDEVRTTSNLPDKVIGKDGKSYPASRSEPKAKPAAPPFKSRVAVQERRERMREMAGEGYTSRQIASELGLTDESCRSALRDEQIDVPADRVTRNARHANADRIVGQIVADAENLTAGVNLINFADIDRERLGEWVDSLIASKKALGTFITRLIKEQQKHGEAA